LALCAFDDRRPGRIAGRRSLGRGQELVQLRARRLHVILALLQAQRGMRDPSGRGEFRKDLLRRLASSNSISAWAS